MKISKSEFANLFLEMIDLETSEPIIKLRGLDSYMLHDLKIDIDKFTDAVGMIATKVDKDLDISPLNEYLPEKVSFWSIITGKFDNRHFENYKPITVEDAANIIYKQNFKKNCDSLGRRSHSLDHVLGTETLHLHLHLGEMHPKGTCSRLSPLTAEVGDYEVTRESGLPGDGKILHYTPVFNIILGQGTDERIAYHEADGDDLTFYTTNHQGSTVMMTEENGELLPYPSGGRYVYDPYGNEMGGASEAGQPYRYTGRRLDAQTGLYYYRARYYSPEIGKLLQTDPIGYEDQMNLYGYVGNDPINATDPSGEKLEILGDKERVARIEGYLDEIRETEEGAETITQLEESDNVHIIGVQIDPDGGSEVGFLKGNKQEQFEKASNGTGTSSYISFDESQADDGNDTSSPASVILAHELGHSQEIDSGTYNPDIKALRERKPGTTPKSELHPLKLGNAVRKAKGLPIRSSYYPSRSKKRRRFIPK